MAIKIECLGTRMNRCYVVRGEEGSLLVDTGNVRIRAQVELRARLADVKLIVLTHGHVDHIANAAYLSEALEIPIAMHPADFPLITDQEARPLLASGLVGHALRSASLRLMRGGVEPFMPPILLADDMALDTYGVDATILSLPGHTMGSVGVLAGDALIAGDAVMPLFPGAKTPRMYEDRAAMKESVRRVMQSSARTIYAGHGRIIRK